MNSKQYGCLTASLSNIERKHLFPSSFQEDNGQLPGLIRQQEQNNFGSTMFILILALAIDVKTCLLFGQASTATQSSHIIYASTPKQGLASWNSLRFGKQSSLVIFHFTSQMSYQILIIMETYAGKNNFSLLSHHIKPPTTENIFTLPFTTTSTYV